MNGHTPPTSYAERLNAFRKSDNDRDDMVNEIITQYEELKLKYDEKCDDYYNEVESRRLWQSKAREHESALREQRQASNSNSFALAVLDGDGAVFQDYLCAMGRDGGADAAHYLHTELRNHLRTLYPESNTSDWNIVVQVVLNLQGLATKLHSCGLISNPNELGAFGRAFGLAQPLFSFIDVGSGKERADHKVRETLRLFLPNAQCKHVFFGPCHDNGYLPVLEPYKRDTSIASRLTLIETLPAEVGFKQLALPRVCFPSIFRTENLPNKPVLGYGIGQYGAEQVPSLHQASPLMHRANPSMSAATLPFVPQYKTSPSSSPAPSADPNKSSNWATVGKAGTTGQAINIAPKKAVPRRCMMLNVHDERLDPPLPATDSNAYGRFNERIKSGRNLCNSFHLLNKCDSGQYCDYQHGERLTPGEQLVLKTKARSLSCPQRSYCRDVDCYFGHHCKFGKTCHMDVCRFADSHSMDMEPAKKVLEDGSEEWLQAYLDKVRK